MKLLREGNRRCPLDENRHPACTLKVGLCITSRTFLESRLKLAAIDEAARLSQMGRSRFLLWLFDQHELRQHWLRKEAA